MEIIKPVILSHLRHKSVLTKDTVANCILCVSESQAPLYKEYNPETEIVTHPDSLIGLTPKIRWTYEKFRNVIMLDDDLGSMVRNFVDKFSDEGREVNKYEAYDIIQSNAFLAQQMGIKFFGFSGSSSPKTFHACNPFKLSGFVIGGSMCFLDGFKMELPDEMVISSDYFLSAINAYYHRKTLIDLRYAFCSPQGTMKSTGGMGSFRNLEVEKNDYEILKEYFGDAISIKKQSAIKKIQHEYERTLSIPF